MFKFSAVSQIWKKYIQNDWDLPLKGNKHLNSSSRLNFSFTPEFKIYSFQK